MAPPPNFLINRSLVSTNVDRLVFLHVPKTGGTSLTVLIRDAVGENALCPERFNDLPLWPAGLLASYRAFAGHFDQFGVSVIPGVKKVVTILRNPRARIISTYRFWRAHSRDQAVRDNLPHVVAAIDLELGAFLRRMRQIAIHNVDNMYARALGGFLPMRGDPDQARRWPLGEFGGGEKLADQAMSFLDSCAAIGILEEFDISISLICAGLQIPVPSRKIGKLMNTEDVARHFGRQNQVKDLMITEDAEEEILELTKYDQLIYQYAKTKFERRAETFRATFHNDGGREK